MAKRKMSALQRKYFGGGKKKRRSGKKRRRAAAPSTSRRSRRAPGAKRRGRRSRGGGSSTSFLSPGGGSMFGKAVRVLPKLARAAGGVIAGAALSGGARAVTASVHKGNVFAETAVAGGVAAGLAIGARPIARMLPVIKRSDVQCAAVGAAADGVFVATQGVRNRGGIVSRAGIPGGRKGVLAGDTGTYYGSDIAEALAIR